MQSSGTRQLVIQNGLKADEARPVEARRQVLGDLEIRSVLAAARETDLEQGWDGDLYRLIVLLAATGGRFSQVRRIIVADLQPDQCRVMLPLSRKGRGQKQTEKIAVPVGEHVLDALMSVVDGRPGVTALLERWRRTQIGPTQWVKDRRGPWRAASEIDV